MIHTYLYIRGFFAQMVVTEGLFGSGIGESATPKIIVFSDKTTILSTFKSSRGQLVLVILNKGTKKLHKHL